jgi:cytoplasmic iron level regulating protein YaaA (DUF328/UPF0246 family)
MKIVISPAKKLDLTSAYPPIKGTTPVFLDEAAEIIEVMRHKTPEEIKQLMKLSDNLANLNWERYQKWHKDIDQTARPAIFTFNGNVYDGLDVKTLPEEKLPELNEKLRILSGLYGILRPFDLIYPYRLEMGTKLSFHGYKNLYEFWRDKVTNYLNQELKDNDFLVNLASQEYFKAIDQKKLKAPVYNIVFKDYKNGELKTISLYAKMARGRMTRFIIQNNINTPEELKLFDMNGYRYDDHLSSDKEFVFTR